MSITSGFFNSLNGDRKYNAEQMSSIFDGIVRDGVFASIGDCFMVKESVSNTITVASGRAWFNHAWLLNDTIHAMTAEASELILDRYDAVVIEINHTDAVRAGSIKFVKGTPSNTPAYPTLAKSDGVYQYPLAYIFRKAGSTSISQADIKNMVGTSECPYVTGILEVHNIDNIVAQWEAQWRDWRAQWQYWSDDWTEWYTETTEEFNNDIVQWMLESKANFDAWFSELQIILDDDVAANLAGKILDIENKFDTLARDKCIIDDLQDSNGEAVKDNNGVVIEGVTMFEGASSSGGNSSDSSKTIVTMLLADHWTGEEAPYSYELTVAGVTFNSNQDIIPDLGITIDQLDALQSANIQDGGQLEGRITLLAYSDKPTIDLPIRVVLRGD